MKCSNFVTVERGRLHVAFGLQNGIGIPLRETIEFRGVLASLVRYRFNPETFEFSVSNRTLRISDERMEMRISDCIETRVGEDGMIRAYCGRYSNGTTSSSMMITGKPALIDYLKDRYIIKPFEEKFLMSWFEFHDIDASEGVRRYREFCEQNGIEEANHFYIKKKTDSGEPVYYMNYLIF